MADFEAAITQAMEAYFSGDMRRIDHAHKVTGYAKQLMAREGGEADVIIAAGLLHDIGIHEAERKYNSTSGKFQEIEGPPIAREIMTRLNFPAAKIDEVCEIIAHHHSPGKIHSVNFKVLYDADWLVNLRDEYDIRDKTKLEHIISRVFLTASGQAEARELYLRE